MNFLRVPLLFALLFGAASLFGQKERPTEEKVNNEKMFVEAVRENILGNHAEAIKLFNDLLRKDKGNAAAYYQLARTYFEISERAKALEKAEQATMLAPENTFYARFYTILLEREGRLEQAAIIIENLLKKYPRTDSLHLIIAGYYQRLNKYDQAIKEYNVIEGHNGIHWETSVNKFYGWDVLNKPNKAILELEALINTYPHNADAYDLLSNYFDKNKMTDKAIELCKRWQTANPNDPRPAMRIARLTRAADGETTAFNAVSDLVGLPSVTFDEKFKSVVSLMNKPGWEKSTSTRQLMFDIGKRIVSNHPNETRAHALYGDILTQGHSLPAAIDAYRRALDLSGAKIEVWQAYLKVLRESAALDQLRTASEECTELFPNHPTGFMYLGWSFLLNGTAVDALDRLQTAFDLSRNFPNIRTEVCALIGSTYQQTGDIKKSDEAFGNAFKVNPDNTTALGESALAYASRKEFDKALENTHRIAQLTPDNLANMMYCAAVLYKKQDYNEAKAVLDKFMNSETLGNPSCPALELYGDILYHLNQVDTAVEYWKKANLIPDKTHRLENKISSRKLAD